MSAGVGKDSRGKTTNWIKHKHKRAPQAERARVTSVGNNEQRNLWIVLGSDEDLKEFMRVILPKFLRVVSPREDGLIDKLYASEVLSDTDNESLSGKDVRNRMEQARKLWHVLNNVPLDIFKERVAPELCQRYPHMIPEQFVAKDHVDVCQLLDGCLVNSCLRHEIQCRIRVKDMADTLYHLKLLKYNTYRQISFNRCSEDDAWQGIFTALQDLEESEECEESNVPRELEAFLKANHVSSSQQQIQDMMKEGFPCVCEHPRVYPPASPFEPIDSKVESWLSRSTSIMSEEYPDDISTECSYPTVISCNHDKLSVDSVDVRGSINNNDITTNEQHLTRTLLTSTRTTRHGGDLGRLLQSYVCDVNSQELSEITPLLAGTTNTHRRTKCLIVVALSLIVAVVTTVLLVYFYVL